MQLFQELAKKQVCDDYRFIESPKLCNEQGTRWLIGYNHLIQCDEDYEKFRNGINKDQALDLLIQDINTSKIVLLNEFNEKYGENKFQQLNIGCQYLLLSILLNSGRVMQYTNLIKECQNEKFYQALKLNGRKNIIDENQNNILKIKCIEEQNFFQEHFDQHGNPKKQDIWKYEIPQATEDEIIYATQQLDDKFWTLEQSSIFVQNSEFEFCNSKSPEWIQFVRDQEGKKYNFVSYNEEQKKWFPVNVKDQEYQIIGYSHICKKREVKAYQDGLTDEQVNYLFLADYDYNCLKLKRFFKKEYPNIDFNGLTSQAQLLLIDLSFRNWPLIKYKQSIDLAIQNRIQEAIMESYIFYRPCENVNSHYLTRQDDISNFLNKISSNYIFKSEAQKNFMQDPNLNKIVGIKITENNFSFVFNEEAETKIQIQDLFTLLKVYYDPQFADQQMNMTFSLEPEKNDQEMNNQFQQKVYFPQYLEGTHVGEVLYEADFLLKQMSLGIEVLQREPLQTRPFDYGNLDIQPLYKLDPENFAILFFKIGKLKLNILEDKNNRIHKLEIEKIQIAVDAKIVNEKLQDEIIQDENNGAYKFAKQFANIYDQISQRYPILIRLKQVLMANYLAKYMFEKGISIDYKFIEEIFNQNLIPNYQAFQSPTLKLNVEDEYQVIDVRGGIDGNTDQFNDQLENGIKIFDENPDLQSYEIQQENMEAKITRCGSASSISTQDSIEDILPQLSLTKLCVKCENKLEQCEIINKVKGNKCKTCLGLKCSQCQNFFEQTLEQIDDDLYCQECKKCHECNKQNGLERSGSFSYHPKCLEISNNSILKKEMIAYIKKYFGTKEKKGDTNSKKITYQSEPYSYLNLKDYSGYIIGYNHPIIKSSKTQINAQTFKITSEQADQQLLDDLKQFENELYQFYIRNSKQPEEIPENIRMLMLFVLFIFKDLKTVLNLANQKSYNNLYLEVQKFDYSKQMKGANMLKGKVEKALDFFNDRFHREDGRLRDKTVINSIKKLLPAKKRN